MHISGDGWRYVVRLRSSNITVVVTSIFASAINSDDFQSLIDQYNNLMKFIRQTIFSYIDVNG